MIGREIQEIYISDGKERWISISGCVSVFIVVLGLPVMITEMSLGRKTRHDPVQAYADIHPHARIVGIFGVLAAFIILSYYSVIGGWILKYIASYVTTAAAPGF